MISVDAACARPNLAGRLQAARNRAWNSREECAAERHPQPQCAGSASRSLHAEDRGVRPPGQQRLAPARIGYGTGVSYINVNRNIIDPKTKRWWEGPNYDGPSDKTVAVIKFETSSGDPIAIY